ncbi:hypothetical protein ACOMHN_014978 [Nucella lapillus]
MTLSIRDLARCTLTLMLTLTVTLRSRAEDGERVSRSVISKDLQERIVSLHNSFRTNIKAKQMLQLRWDDDLAEEANEWVEQCDFIHKDNNTRGENIYRSELDNSVSDVAARGVLSWTVEISYMIVAERTNEPCCDAIKNTTLCCNYQQVVWSETRKVGCGLTKCGNLTGPDQTYANAWFFACYYDPPGNVASTRPYQRAAYGGVTGEVCSLCPYIFDQCQNSLCTPSSFCRGNP